MQLLHGSAHAIDLPAGSVQCVVTSPPYWGLRSYAGEQAVEWPAVSYAPMPGLPEITIPAQTCGLGLEPDINAYIGHMVLCLREWRRVLRDDGTCWVNLGDSYAGGGGFSPSAPSNQHSRAGQRGTQTYGVGMGIKPANGLKPKDLCGIPWRFAFAAQAEGWWLRSDIIWAKPNPMPESVQGSHFSRHRVTIQEYENLSRLRIEQGGNPDRASDLPGLSAREMPGSEAPLSTEREGPSDDAGKRGTRGRKGEAAFVQSFGARSIEQGQIRGDGQGPDHAQEGDSEVQSQRQGEAIRGRTTPENEGFTPENRTEETSERTLHSLRQGEGEQAARLRQTQRCDSIRATSDSRGLVGDRETTQESLPLLWEAQGIDDRSCDPTEQGREACDREHSPGVPELQFEEEGQSDSTLLVDCPGCPKCEKYGGYILHLSAGRPTRAHEYVFLLAKSARYYYDADAVREPLKDDPETYLKKLGKKAIEAGTYQEVGAGRKTGGFNAYKAMGGWTVPAGRNCRSVWTLATQSFAGSHFAVFPERIPELCIRAGTSAHGCCPECGAPWVRDIERTANYEKRQDRGQPNGVPPQVDSSGWRPATVTDNGWRPGCDHGHEPVPCTVLDPFSGSGTTGRVALRLGREYVGVDISAEYLTTVTDARFADGVQIEMNL